MSYKPLIVSQAAQAGTDTFIQGSGAAVDNKGLSPSRIAMIALLIELATFSNRVYIATFQLAYIPMMTQNAMF